MESALITNRYNHGSAGIPAAFSVSAPDGRYQLGVRLAAPPFDRPE
jgi:hypothetical protein